MQYVVKPHNSKENVLSLLLEEIIDIDKEEHNHYSSFVSQHGDMLYVMNRLIHMEFNIVDFSVEHLDFSHLYYNLGAYTERINNHLHKKAIRATIKHKIFKINSPIPWHNALQIIGAALDANRNPEVQSFLAGK